MLYKMSDSTNIRMSLLNLGLLFSSIECIHLGLISPIEVVEEFGCHDTELRLTCGNLDSKIAVLEATFAPNCTHDECLQFDMKRLVRTFASVETEDSKNAEKEAGQKFLETLRQSHLNEEDIDVDILEDSHRNNENTNHSTGQIKRTNLRLVLERLIMQYLRRISPEDDLGGEGSSRSRRNILTDSSHLQSVKNDTNEDFNSSEEYVIRINKTRPYCVEQRREISSLNRLDLEKSYQNQSDNEYNIRRVLNKRCSGKNHCSFIFSIDHPFSKVWEDGLVRVKYMCMDDFRINHYCGEHLTIGYEIDPNIQILDNYKGEPKSEPRIQPRETSLHSLKIIKADKIEASDNKRNVSSNPEEIRKIKGAVTTKYKEGLSEEHRNEVYSQDFRVFKILPSNLDDFNDIETIGDEIYFRKDEMTTEQSNVNELHYSSTAAVSKAVSSNENKVSHNDRRFLENITLTIREGGHFITVYPISNSTLSRVPSNLSVDGTRNKSHADNTTKHLFQYDSFSVPLHKKKIPVSENGISTESPISMEYKSEEEKDDNKSDKSGLGEILNADDHHTNLDKSGITYNSIQKTSYRSPLLHGFTMTPGYPKFYIGDFNCQWNIIAPEGIRVWITIIDNSLRFDETCKDFLKIDDFGMNKTLYSSCTDTGQPIKIIGISNWLKVTVKTTSKFAYPKRGVLLHYTADGCVNPPLPSNVKLIDRTATAALYECHPSFLFPDSRLSTRTLICNTINVWDKLLPNCVEQENLYKSEVPSEERFTLLHKKPDLSIITSIMPSQKDADVIFDIIIPSVLIIGLFIINGAVFAIIMKYRKRSKALGDREMELAEL